MMLSTSFSSAEKKRKSRSNLEIMRLKDEAIIAIESSNTLLTFLDYIEAESSQVELEN